MFRAETRVTGGGGREKSGTVLQGGTGASPGAKSERSGLTAGQGQMTSVVHSGRACVSPGSVSCQSFVCSLCPVLS